MVALIFASMDFQMNPEHPIRDYLELIQKFGT